MYGDQSSTGMQNPIKGGGWGSDHSAAVLVIGMLVFLWLVRRGFRGVSMFGASVGVG